MLEIRKQLLASGKELLLFLEDLSVTQGMDAELIESLIVKPSEADGQLCVLRSIVGLTNEDFRSLPSNIRGRIDLAVSFDVSVDADQKKDPNKGQVADFASRYLNAARYTRGELDAWSGKEEADGVDLPSFCEESHCPNRPECHRVFGEVGGRGLYPFNGIALTRLYNQLQGEERAAFNPRLLVGQVLGEFLKRAEGQLALHTFPGPDLREWYELGQIPAGVRAQINQRRGALAPRLLTAIELYAKSPGLGRLPADVADKFGLPGEQPSAVETAPEPVTQPAAPTVESETRQPARVAHDVFDAWSLPDGRVADGDLNDWRKAVYEAMNGARDWDSDPLGPLFRERVKRASIHFEGQFTAMSGDVKIEIKRSAETAVALRGLVKGFQTRDEVFVRHCLRRSMDR